MSHCARGAPVRPSLPCGCPVAAPGASGFRSSMVWLFPHFPGSLTVIRQTVTLTQSSREGQELGVRSEQRNWENPVKWKLRGWGSELVSQLPSGGHTSPKPRKKRCLFTALGTMKGQKEGFGHVSLRSLSAAARKPQSYSLAFSFKS